jgi:hypothetical protein
MTDFLIFCFSSPRAHGGRLIQGLVLHGHWRFSVTVGAEKKPEQVQILTAFFLYTWLLFGPAQFVVLC